MARRVIPLHLRRGSLLLSIICSTVLHCLYFRMTDLFLIQTVVNPDEVLSSRRESNKAKVGDQCGQRFYIVYIQDSKD